MKILIISDLFPPNIKGGYELRCEEACNWLHDNNHQIEVLTTLSKETNIGHQFPVNRLLVPYPLGKTPSEWSFPKKVIYAIKDNLILRRIIKRVNPDLIYVWHCQGLSRALIPVIFSSQIDKIVDVSDKWLLKVKSQHGPIHRFLEENHRNYLHTILQMLLRLLIPILSLNTIHKKYKLDFKNSTGYFTSRWNKQLQSEQIIECKNFNVIYTGINPSIFPYKKKDNFSIPIKLLYIGRISEEKGFVMLLNQLKIVEMSGIKFEMKVVGEYSSEMSKKKILNLIDEFKLSNIIFEGKQNREKLYKYYHEAHFTVFPSICDEAFSRIPLESLACGTPCISTNNPGSKELFEQAVPLIKLEVNSDSLLNTMRQFTENEQEYLSISQKGYESVNQNFTFQKYMEKVNLMLLKILSNTSGK
ncbi:MAG: glycosyltransferase family 4 protein [Candidatus Marinimicrobia bacterium]|nr:glycosyltransferase family 4 protein [Candidatus Neomarinimicrobiota bacterium]MBL7109676.1 glycosyltransferase family 4 protein [Candidatus Neomarinimicrobiota bacterium]